MRETPALGSQCVSMGCARGPRSLAAALEKENNPGNPGKETWNAADPTHGLDLAKQTWVPAENFPEGTGEFVQVLRELSSLRKEEKLGSWRTQERCFPGRGCQKALVGPSTAHDPSIPYQSDGSSPSCPLPIQLPVNSSLLTHHGKW